MGLGPCAADFEALTEDEYDKLMKETDEEDDDVVKISDDESDEADDKVFDDDGGQDVKCSLVWINKEWDNVKPDSLAGR